MKQRLGECEECIFIQLPGLPSTLYIKSSRLGSYICRVSHSCSSTAAEISDLPFHPPPPSLKAEIWLAWNVLIYCLKSIYVSSEDFDCGAPHLGGDAAKQLSVGAFTVLAQVFATLAALPQAMSPSRAHNDAWFISTALCILQRHRIRRTAEPWRPGTIPFVYFWTWIQLFFSSLSLVFSGAEPKDCVGCKPLLIQKMIFGMYQSIHDSGGWGAGGRGLKLAFFFLRSFQSKTNKLACLHIAAKGNSSQSLLLGG